MKFTRIFAVMLALLPSHAFASGLLSSGELRSVISMCFDTFSSPLNQPFNVDRRKLAGMGFKIKEDTVSDFEAKITIREGVYSMRKLQLGPELKIRRHKRKQTDLKHKSCNIERGALKTSEALITKLPSPKVHDIMVAEAKRRGFKPVRNSRGKIVWVKGETAVLLHVSFTAGTGSYNPNSPPSFISVDGVHPKNLK